MDIKNLGWLFTDGKNMDKPSRVAVIRPETTEFEKGSRDGVDLTSTPMSLPSADPEVEVYKDVDKAIERGYESLGKAGTLKILKKLHDRLAEELERESEQEII